ncbi:thioesterase domain-containing protein [Geminocystis sp. GBBB08]|uniref:thioesterase domain-containing protein n=1 Tax=Geminocystis sp. GBBB08 TaxID=2604140 RepID=UPI0027E2DD71|nr:thioesterase domain-containing protein [Geminocystis sp. GBBB08]MBL1210547.1 AMP-binding protein [Geminocystis sp. GBBB08]
MSSIIGRPISNTQIYILDNYLQPLPVGIIGEIYIGGVGVARGYLNLPELTAEKFIPNPFGEGKLYKTGDLARYLPDGNIDFIGRVDNQVKIRGFRIELAEIEIILHRHPDIKECLVIVKENSDGDKYLSAYIITKKEISIAEIREFLLTKLPNYMIPNSFVFLDKFPLTPNGKMDHKALPEPYFSTSFQHQYLPPQNEREFQLTQIWENVLQIHPIGIKDNFFDLGGHSLLAVRLVSEIETIYQKKLPLATLFQAPTIEQLAKILQENNYNHHWQSLVAIQPKGSKLPLFCCHGVDGNVMFFRNLAIHLGDNQPVYGLQAKGLDRKENPLTSIKEMAENYIEEMRILQPKGPYFLTGFCYGGIIALEIAQQLLNQGEKVAFLGLLNVLGPKIKESKKNLLKRHWQKFSTLNIKERIKYIKRRIRWRIKMIHLRNKSLITEEQREDAPEKMLYENIMKAITIAIKNYKIEPYQGVITLINTEMDLVKMNSDSQRGWGEIALEGLEMYDIPGDHNDMLKEPYVKLLAEKLKICLKESEFKF